MSNWVRIGVPVLVAVLLIVSAVSITLAVTASGNARQLAAAPIYTSPGTDEPVGYGAKCANCPATSEVSTTGIASKGSCPNSANCPNAGNCGGTCTGSTIKCTGSCQGNTATGARTGTLRSGCGSCRTY